MEKSIVKWKGRQPPETDTTNVPFIITSLSTLTPLVGNISLQAQDDLKIAALSNFFDLVSAVAPRTSPEILAQIVNKITAGDSVMQFQNRLSSHVRYNPFIRGGGSKTSLEDQAKLIKRTFESLPKRCEPPPDNYVFGKNYRELDSNDLEEMIGEVGEDTADFFARLRGKLTICRIIRIAWLIQIVLVPWHQPVVYSSFLDDLLTMMDDIVSSDTKEVPSSRRVRVGYDTDPDSHNRAHLPYDHPAWGIHGLSLKDGFDLLKDIILSEIGEFNEESIPKPEKNANNGVLVHNIPYRNLMEFRSMARVQSMSASFQVGDIDSAKRIIDEVKKGGYQFWIEKSGPGNLFNIVQNSWIIDIFRTEKYDYSRFFIVDAAFADYRLENVSMMTNTKHVHEHGKWLRTLTFIHRQLLMACEYYGEYGLDVYWRYRYSIHAVQIVREIAYGFFSADRKLTVARLLSSPTTTRERLRGAIGVIFEKSLDPEKHFLDQLAETLARKKSPDAKETPFKQLYRSVVVEMLIGALMPPPPSAAATLPRREKIHSGSIDPAEKTKPEDAVAHALLPYEVPADFVDFTTLIPDLEEISKKWFAIDKKRPTMPVFFYTETYRLRLCGTFDRADVVSMRVFDNEKEEFYGVDSIYSAAGFIPAINLQARFAAIVEVELDDAKSFNPKYPKLLPSSVASLNRYIGIFRGSASMLSPKKDPKAAYVISLYLDKQNQQQQKHFPDNSSTEFVVSTPLSSIMNASDKTLWEFIKSHPVSVTGGDLEQINGPGILKRTTSPQGVTFKHAKAWYSSLDPDHNGTNKWQQMEFRQPPGERSFSSFYKSFVPFEKDEGELPDLD
jgi:hypothetical protein